MNRRSFLASIIAAGVAPAFVRSPMKLWVPRDVAHYIWTTESPIGGLATLVEDDYPQVSFVNTQYDGDIVEYSAIVNFSAHEQEVIKLFRAGSLGRIAATSTPMLDMLRSRR